MRATLLLKVFVLHLEQLKNYILHMSVYYLGSE